MKILTTQLLIFALLTVSLPVSIFAQAQPVPIAEGSVASENTTENTSTEKPDLKTVFDKKTKELRDRSAFFDVKKAEKEERKQQAKKKTWDKGTTIGMILIAVGMAALVFLLIKYGKDCLRTNYPGCDWVNDEGCVCEEYAKRVKN